MAMTAASTLKCNTFAACRIPDDWEDTKLHAPFMARPVMGELIEQPRASKRPGCNIYPEPSAGAACPTANAQRIMDWLKKDSSGMTPFCISPITLPQRIRARKQLSWATTTTLPEAFRRTTSCLNLQTTNAYILSPLRHPVRLWGCPSFQSPSSDVDNLIDGFEYLLGTGPHHSESGQDVIPDGVESPQSAYLSPPPAPEDTAEPIICWKTASNHITPNKLSFPDSQGLYSVATHIVLGPDFLEAPLPVVAGFDLRLPLRGRCTQTVSSGAKPPGTPLTTWATASCGCRLS